MKTIIKKTSLKNGVLASIVILLISFASTTFAHGSHVLPAKSKPFGQSYKEWAIDFTRWAYSIPFDNNPVFNKDVTHCTLPQYG
ncbi:MAG: hypothetical protein WCH01_21210, partial [Methylococcaceae bacterium]